MSCSSRGLIVAGRGASKHPARRLSHKQPMTNNVVVFVLWVRALKNYVSGITFSNALCMFVRRTCLPYKSIIAWIFCKCFPTFSVLVSRL